MNKNQYHLTRAHLYLNYHPISVMTKTLSTFANQSGTHILFIFRSNVTTGLDRIEAVSNQSADKVNKLEDMVRNKPKKSKTMVPILDGIA